MSNINQNFSKKIFKPKTCKSSHRVKSRNSNKNQESNIIITKDEENNVYHILSKDNLTQFSETESHKFKQINTNLKYKKKRRKDSKIISSGNKKKKRKIRKLLQKNN